MENHELAGKIYLVAGIRPLTDADRVRGIQIGFAEAALSELVKKGAKVIATYHKTTPSEDFRDNYGENVDYVPFDALDEGSYDKLRHRLAEAGSIDGIVHALAKLEALDRRRGLEILRKIKGRKDENQAKVDRGEMPDANILSWQDFTPEEQNRAMMITAGSYKKMLSSFHDVLKQDAPVVAYSLKDFKHIPNYAMAPAKDVLESIAEFYQDTSGKNVTPLIVRAPAVLTLSSSFFPYINEFLEYMQMLSSDGRLATSRDIGKFTVDVLQHPEKHEDNRIIEYNDGIRINPEELNHILFNKLSKTPRITDSNIVAVKINLN